VISSFLANIQRQTLYTLSCVFFLKRLPLGAKNVFICFEKTLIMTNTFDGKRLSETSIIEVACTKILEMRD